MNTFYKVLVVVLIILSFILGRCNKASNNIEPSIKLKTDTVIVYKEFKPDKELPIEKIVETITIYQVDTIVMDSIIFKEKIVYIHTKEDTISYHNNFLTNFTNSSKLVQLNLTNELLELTLLNTKGIVQTQSYTIDTERYSYLFDSENKFSSSRLKVRSALSLRLQYLLKPLVFKHDLNSTLVVKTSKINYIGGISLEYNNSFNKPFTITPVIGIEYTF